MEVRLQDIANELNVSTVTVSRSMRHDASISPQTRARVHEVARRLGYSGRSGKVRRSEESDTKGRILGLLLRHETLDAAQHDPHLMQMMAGIMSVTDRQGMHLKVHTWPADEWPHLDEDPAALPSLIQEGGCQALIVHGYHEDRNLNFLSHRLPLVSMGRHYRDLPIDAAVADNVDGVHRLVTHLVELGHQRLAWVGASYSWSFTEAREAGFMQGCRRHGLGFNAHSFFGPEIYEGRQIRDDAALLAAVEAGVTGFVCGSDFAAFQVVRILEAAGKRVPDDISVTGFDAAPGQAKLGRVTSVAPEFFEIGKAAARLALQRKYHPTDKPCIMTVRGGIVLGDTTAKAL